MKSVVIQTVAENFGVNFRAAGPRVLEFFQNQRRRAFPHYKSVAQFVERPTGHLRIFAAAHRLDNVERANGDRGQRRFCSACNNHIGKIVADVTQRFADRNRSARATVRVRCADAAKSEIDGDIGMSRPAKNLHGQRGLNAACAFLQKSNVLFFRFANAAERGSETDADPVLWFLFRIFNSAVFERKFSRRDRKLCVAIEPLQTMWRKEFFWVPIVDLSGDANAEGAHVKIRNRSDSGFLGENSVPKAFHAFTHASDWAKAGDDNASSAHAVTVFVRAST